MPLFQVNFLQKLSVVIESDDIVAAGIRAKEIANANKDTKLLSVYLKPELPPVEIEVIQPTEEINNDASN